MPISAAERSENARIAALTRSAQEPSGTAMTAKARQSFWDSFETGHECAVCAPVVIDQSIPKTERQRQAAAARSAHFSRIARNARIAATAARGRKAPDAAL
jgi:hypothetical protein